MNQNKDNYNFIKSLIFSFNNQNILYALLNKYQPINKLIQLRDIDILINIEDRNNCIINCLILLSKFNMKIKQIKYRSYVTQIYYYSTFDGKIFQIDLLNSTYFRFTSLTIKKDLFENRVKKFNIYFARNDDLVSYNASRKKLINKFKVNKSDKFITKIYKNLLYFSKCIENLELFKIIFLERFRFFCLCFENANKPLIISFMGPDGSGKSTIINKLNNKLSQSKINLEEFYIFLGFFSRFRKSKKKYININPHGTIQRNIFMQYLKLIFYSTECFMFIVYKKFLQCGLIKKNKLLIFDRYPYDIFMDPFRYGFSKIPKFILKFLVDILTPRPFLNIILECPYHIANKRKKELTEKQYKLISSNYSTAYKFSPHTTFFFDSNELNPEIIVDIMFDLITKTKYYLK